MNKAELTEKLIERTGLSSRDARAAIDAIFDARGEGEAPRGGVPAHQILEPRLVNGNSARLQERDLGGVIVNADDVVAGLAKACAGSQANVSGSDHC